MTAIQTAPDLLMPTGGRRDAELGDPGSRDRAPSLWTLTKVEVRKALDTRAGMWLLITIGVLTLVIETVALARADDHDRTFDTLLNIALVAQAVLLPVLGILLVTSEWSQRSGLVTFALVPIRSRVATAKIAASLALAVGAFAFAIAVGVLATIIYPGDSPWNLSVGDLGDYAVAQLLIMLSGVAFGLLFLQSAIAIVVYFVVPTVWTILFNSWGALDSARHWLDITSASESLNNHEMGGAAWPQLLVASTIWIFIPLGIGLYRLMRVEIK
jgi:ABC-type transport system involved in multi-copper enzyme maturation permease subunit